MRAALIFFLVIVFCSFFSCAANECGLEVRFLQSLSNVQPGLITSIQAEIFNRSCHQRVLVGHLELPIGWETIPANDLLLHIEIGQSAIQTLMIKVPDTVQPGEYTIAYEVFARNNFNILDRDTASILIGEIKGKDAPLAVEITSDELSLVQQDDVFYLTALVKNQSKAEFDGAICLEMPCGWTCFPSELLPITLDDGGSKPLIYGIKIPQDALAGEYEIFLSLNGYPAVRRSCRVAVASKVNVVGKVDGLCKAYSINEPAELFLRYCNRGNVALNVFVECETQPACSLYCKTAPFELSPQESCEIPVRVMPLTNDLIEFSQFLSIKLIDCQTQEVLYQNPMTLKFVSEQQTDDDPYVRIPVRFKMMALGDRYNSALAAEYSGGGVIDAEKKRSVEFVFRVPTDCHHVIYNIDQRLYAAMFDPNWDIRLGDTVYELSPLTQRYRYGRGAGFQYFDEKWSYGAHYTQNTLKSDCNPREFCSYIEWCKGERFCLSANYLHKVEQGIPTSNILTLQSDFEFPKNFRNEIEFGENFLSKRSHRDNKAFRIATNGKLPRDSWFSFEKVYAGPDFYGYYQHLHLLSSSLDFPLGNRLRANLNVNRYTQNFSPCVEDEDEAITPRQHQYLASLNYRISPACSFALNGQLLRGKDLGLACQYNFYQKWAGFSLFCSTCGFHSNTIVSFGTQKDYLTHKTTHFLQRYYTYLCKDISPNFTVSVFYEGGNINYYDAGPWRTSYGASMAYRFGRGGAFELYLQRVKQPTDCLDMSQVTCNFNYTFKNNHRLQATAQYFYYPSHYPKDTTFLLTYTIPFSIPFCKRQDIGNLCGMIYNYQDHTPVPEALVECQGKHAATDANGRFMFKCLPRGCYSPSVIKMCDPLIAYENSNRSIEIEGGDCQMMFIPAISSCKIRGVIEQLAYKDLFEMMQNPNDCGLVVKGGLNNICIGIELEGSDEVYTTLSNCKGEFFFPKLRPGSWHIKVFVDELPELHTLDMNEITLDVKPGEDCFITFTLRPKPIEFYPLTGND